MVFLSIFHTGGAKHRAEIFYMKNIAYPKEFSDYNVSYCVVCDIAVLGDCTDYETVCRTCAYPEGGGCVVYDAVTQTLLVNGVTTIGSPQQWCGCAPNVKIFNCVFTNNGGYGIQVP